METESKLVVQRGKGKEQRLAAKGYRISFEDDGNVQKSIVVMVT